MGVFDFRLPCGRAREGPGEGSCSRDGGGCEPNRCFPYGTKTTCGGYMTAFLLNNRAVAVLM